MSLPNPIPPPVARVRGNRPLALGAGAAFTALGVVLALLILTGPAPATVTGGSSKGIGLAVILTAIGLAVIVRALWRS